MNDLRCKSVFFAFMVLVSASPSPCAQVRRGNAQFQRYEDRIAHLEADLKDAGQEKKKDILLELSNLYLARAHFFKALWESAATMQRVYFEQLERNGLSRDLSSAYRGMALFELGRSEEAVTFLAGAASSSKVPQEQAQVARAWAAAAQYRAGRQEKANQIWSLLEQKNRRLAMDIMFLKTRVHAIPPGGAKLPAGDSHGQMSQGEIKDIAFILAAQGEAGLLREYLERIDPGDPSVVENRDAISETRYYDLSALFVVYRGSLLLGKDYASQFGALIAQGDQRRAHAAVNRAICMYESDDLEDAIDVLRDCDDPIGRVYLAAAVARKGDRHRADSLVSMCLAANSPDILGEFGRIFLDVPGFDVQRYSVDVCRRALDLSKSQLGAKKEPPQSLYGDLAIGLMRTGEIEEALMLFNKGYRMDLQDNLLANDPEFIVRYAAAIVAGAHFRNISTAIRMLVPVVALYRCAIQVTDPISKLDVLTVGKTNGGATLTN